MNISIGSKISKLRKQNNLTQEQLAELLNISNAAVSKWESGNTYPDIETLPLIAKIFKISIDSLFEFDINNESLDEFYKQAEMLRLNGNKNDLISLLDDALKVYPNDFNLNLMMAKALLDKSLNINPVDKNLAKKSIKYYDKALILDKDGKNSASIIQNKSFVLGSIGQYEEANKLLSSLKQESHTVQIANNLIKMGKYEEGMKKLQTYLNSITFDFAWLCGTLDTCFKKLGKNKESYEITKMVAYFREFMTLSNDPNYYDFLCSKDFIDVASIALKNNDFEEMWKAIKKSVYHAVRFDKNPSFEVNKVNFLFSLEGNFYNGNTCASKYIIKILKDDFAQFKDDERYQSFLNELESTFLITKLK